MKNPKRLYVLTDSNEVPKLLYPRTPLLKKSFKFPDGRRNLCKPNTVKEPKKFYLGNPQEVKEFEKEALETVENFPRRKLTMSSKKYTVSFKPNEETNNVNLMTFSVERVKNLSTWEEENIAKEKESHETLSKALNEIYTREKRIDKLLELKHIEKILSSAFSLNPSFISENSKSNKALEKEYLNKQREQSSILMNSISKTTHRFSVLFNQEDIQKHLSHKFNLDSKTLNTINKEITNGIPQNYDFSYRKVIESQTKIELTMKNDLQEIIDKLEEKKKEKKLILKNIDLTYAHLKEKEEYYSKIKGKIVENLKLLQGVSNADFSNQIKVARLDKEMTSTKAEEELAKKKIYDEREELRQNLKMATTEESYLKYIHSLVLKEQREYFYRILKNGYDVRNEGLTWVAKKLLELKSPLDYSHFPIFLTHEEIDYLILQSKLAIEESILLKKISEMKKNQKRLMKDNFEEETKIHRAKTKYYTTQSDKCSTTFDNLDERVSFLRGKYGNVLKDNLHDKIIKEDEEAKELLTDLHKSVINGTMLIKRSKTSSALSKIFEDEENRENIARMTMMRARLKVLKNEQHQQKKEMIEYIKEKEEKTKCSLSIEASLNFDLVYAAIFGSEILSM